MDNEPAMGRFCSAPHRSDKGGVAGLRGPQRARLTDLRRARTSTLPIKTGAVAQLGERVVRNDEVRG
ncbi:MAG: hypothetical protein ACOC20_05425, partial [Oceanicaulis sp.]